MDLDALFAGALEKRALLMRSKQTDALRLFHGSADGLDGLVIEQFADVLVVQTFPDRRLPAESVLADSVERLRQRLAARSVYRKIFVADRAAAPANVQQLHASEQPWLGEPSPAEITIEEHDLRYAIHPYEGFSVGLFLEHRENRRRVRELATGRRVLNTFAYTCAFSVAAAAGGAASVSSVDLSRRYLEWGKRNFELNGLPDKGHWFFCSDTLEFYARARRQGRRFDLVILDPPTFARLRRPQRTFVLEEQLDALVAGAVELLDPGGIVLLATNARPIGLDRMRQALQRVAGGRSYAILDLPASPLDFSGDPDYSKAVIAEFA